MNAAVDALPLDRLAAFLRDRVPGAVAPLRVEPLSGGSSNVTLRVRDGVHDWVLRRPPFGLVLPTANDMVREHRVQHALAGTGVPVPKMVAVCDDEAVIGVPFYVMHWLDGVVYTDADAVAHLTPEQAHAAAIDLVDVLARLHGVDYESVGLGDLGRPEGFLERHVGRWCQQWERSKDRDVAAIDELASRLRRDMPAHQDRAIVHGDFSFNNAMYSRERPEEMIALLDWEMATLGDPLTDVGMLAAYWGPVGELMWQSRGLQAHRSNPGFPSIDVLLEHYEAQSGRSLEAVDFYVVLAAFKLAVIVEGHMARQRVAGEPNPANPERPEELAQAALELADQVSRDE